MTRADHQKGIDAAKEAVIHAAIAWWCAMDTRRNSPGERLLRKTITRLRLLEDAAIRALPGRGEKRSSG